MNVIKDDIIWKASIAGMRARYQERVSLTQKSLDSLKNQTGLYADEHRAMIRLYQDIATAIDVHDQRRCNPENEVT